MTTAKLICGDSLEFLKSLPDDSVDLCITSPPYSAQRRYGALQFSLTGQKWVDWCVERWIECDRVCRGLVVWVVEGSTKKFQWSATPALLMADLHRAGIKLRKPPAFNRVGIPGSGGPDFWRNDWEFCVCSSKGRLPWSDNTANGLPCKYGPGGAMSNRLPSGIRVGDRWNISVTQSCDNESGERVRSIRRGYKIPEKANAGNVLVCTVGGGKMGHPLAHDNEAPFPVQLIDPFVRCFCPPSGTVLDIFCGSGSSGQAAMMNGRNYLGCDIRRDQVELSERRLVEFGDVEVSLPDYKQKEFFFSE